MFLTPFYVPYAGGATIQFACFTNAAPPLQQASATFASGDVKIVIDGAASANTTNLPASEGNGIYSLVLTTGETTGTNITITATDVAGGPTFLAFAINIVTCGHASARIPFKLNDIDPDVDVVKWLGTAAATPTVAGVPEVDVTHAAGTVLGAAAAGYLPADSRRVDGVALGSHTAGYFPDDVRQIDGSVLGSHANGHLPADTRYWLGTAAATPTVAGVPEVDVTHSSGTVLAAHSSGMIPADVQALEAGSMFPHATGLFPADLRYSEGGALITHLAGTVPADIRAINGDVNGANFLDYLGDTAVNTQVTGSPTSTSWVASGLTSTLNDVYVDRVGIITTGTMAGRAFFITDYDGSTKTLTVDLLPQAPAVNDFFVILP